MASRQYDAPDITLAQVLAEDKSPRWAVSPALIRLYCFIVPVCLAVPCTNGYDGTVLTGLQGVSFWKLQFGSPTGSLLGIISAAYPLGAMMSTPVSAFISDRFGRRWSILIGSVIMILGVVMQTASSTVGLFLGGRIVIGFGITMALTAAPILISELAHPRHRVLFGSLYNTCFYLGALTAGWTVFGSINIQNSWAWRLPTMMQALFATIQTIFVFFLDESPRWLCFKGRNDEAYAILTKYHGNGDPDSLLVRAEYHEMVQALEIEKEAKVAGPKLFFTTPGNRKRLFLLISLAFFAQWSGNGLVSYYLTKILGSIGITAQREQTMIVGIVSTVNWITAILAAITSTRASRRAMFIGGGIAMWVTFSALTASIAVYTSTTSKAASQSALAFIFIYYTAYNVALNPLVFLYPTEILPFRLRAMGMSVLVFSTKAASFFNQFVNPIGMDSLGWKYYLVYVGFLLVEVAIFWFYYPETSGRTLEKIGEIFGDTVTHDDSTGKAAETYTAKGGNAESVVVVEEYPRKT